MKYLKFTSVLFALLIISQLTGIASDIDTLSVYSKSMKKDVKVIVVKPSSYSPTNKKAFVTTYVLHGYSGYPERILEKDIPTLPELADLYNMFFILPDGNYDSWYLDSPIKNDSQYETFVAKELVKHIEKEYKLPNKKKHRAITGWSMGGHGALYVGSRNSKVFKSIGSLCGAFDFKPYGHDYGLNKLLGKNKTKWDGYTAIDNIKHLKKSKQNIIISCGVNDELIPQSRQLHELLLKQKTKHTYIESPGKHDDVYWSKAAIIQIHWIYSALK